MSTEHPAIPQSIQRVYAVIRAQGPTAQICVARCCGRVYVGLGPAVKCSTCEEAVKNTEIRSEADLDNP